MKYLISFLICMIVGIGHAQVPTQATAPSIENEADRLVEIYNENLVLTDVQLPLFRNKLEDYLKLAEEARKNLDGKEELDALVEIQTNETLQMKNILTQNQLKLYKKIKPKVQPLKVVDTND